MKQNTSHHAMLYWAEPTVDFGHHLSMMKTYSFCSSPYESRYLDEYIQSAQSIQCYCHIFLPYCVTGCVQWLNVTK